MGFSPGGGGGGGISQATLDAALPPSLLIHKAAGIMPAGSGNIFWLGDGAIASANPQANGTIFEITNAALARPGKTTHFRLRASGVPNTVDPTVTNAVALFVRMYSFTQGGAGGNNVLTPNATIGGVLLQSPPGSGGIQPGTIATVESDMGVVADGVYALGVGVNIAFPTAANSATLITCRIEAIYV